MNNVFFFCLFAVILFIPFIIFVLFLLPLRLFLIIFILSSLRIIFFMVYILLLVFCIYFSTYFFTLFFICAHFCFHLLFVPLSFPCLNWHAVLQDAAANVIHYRSQDLDPFCTLDSVPMTQAVLTLSVDTKPRTGRTDGLSYEKSSVPHQHPAPYHR